MKQNIGRTIVRVSPFIAGFLVIVEIVLTNQLAGGGRTVLAVDSSIDELREQNAILEQKVASASSLITVAAKASGLGFVEPTKTQFISIAPSELPVALVNQRY